MRRLILGLVAFVGLFGATSIASANGPYGYHHHGYRPPCYRPYGAPVVGYAPSGLSFGVSPYGVSFSSYGGYPYNAGYGGYGYRGYGYPATGYGYGATFVSPRAFGYATPY